MKMKFLSDIKSTIFLSAVLIFGIGAFWIPYGKEFIDKARFAEVQTNLSSLQTALSSYHQEYGRYSSDEKEIGFAAEGHHGVEFYLDKTNVPPDVLGKLTSDQYPFVSQDSYRILVAYENRGELKLFINDKGQPLLPVEIK
ncbi:hypothetical protein [Bdellovibrio sp. HCB209]|uniref:hypothetical protein n=1 Tax=Bdellovibrio sp. HCB209 TaxID=3394354 RepID=UPI0039B64517